MTNQLTTTVCALSTPPGLGGIATVRLSGPEALSIAARVFFPQNTDKKVENAKGYTALFGHYRLNGQEMDETVALFFRAPHSYTGEDVVELSVHGGSAMADGLLEALYAAGASPAASGEFTRRALVNGRMDLAQAEAVMELIEANSRQGAILANGTLKGTLSNKINEISNKILSLQSHIAAWTDYPEEDVLALDAAQLGPALRRMQGALDRMLEQYAAGRVLLRGVDTVIAGKPNVGKSTLLNLLSGYDRAIVTPVAGTTRDVLEQQVRLPGSGVTLNLFDTAGLHRTEDPIEQEGIRRARQKLAEAGLIIAVFDQSRPISQEDLELAEQCLGRPALAVFNKDDLSGALDTELLAQYFQLAVPLCMKEDGALTLLSDAIGRILQIHQPDPDAACLVTARQQKAALAARDALQQAQQAMELGLDAVGVCLDDAQAALYALTGKNAADAVIEQVFERFCVGK